MLKRFSISTKLTWMNIVVTGAALIVASIGFLFYDQSNAREELVQSLSTEAQIIASNSISKGDVLSVARVAGIQAAKQTPNLIPLCHPLLVGSVFVNFTIGDDCVEVEAQVETIDRTGVEMEAMTACSVAALTVYDMCKSVDRSITVTDLALWEKSGGRSGVYRRVPAPDEADSTL